MANLFKPPVTKIDPETGDKIKGKTKKWYGRYRDENGTEHRVEHCVNLGGFYDKKLGHD